MAEQTTFVKFDRNLRTWRWFQSPKTLLVWIWLIMSANIEAHDFEHETIRRGEVVTSRKSICKATGLTENEVRTALNHLKSTGEITVRLRPKYQVITIVEYNKYQDISTGKSTGRPPAKHRQATGRPPQSKNIRMEEGKEGKDSSCAATTTTIHIPPSVAEVDAYCMANGIRTDVNAFVAFNASRGWKRGNMRIEDWRPLLMQWASKDNLFSGAGLDDDDLDDFGRPVRKEFK